MPKSFDEWKAEKVVTDVEILGGEPVFSGTRLSIRHVGRRAERDAVATIVEDYPYLDAQDVMFANQYSKEGSS